MKGFNEALKAVYKQQPCRTLPNALWKTLKHQPTVKHFEIEDGTVTEMTMIHDGTLHLYWNQKRTLFGDVWGKDQSFNLVLIHQDYIHAVPLEEFYNHQKFFRLQYQGTSVEEVDLPVGLQFTSVDFDNEQEYQQAADLIAACYPKLNPGPSEINEWRNHPVFAPKLWFWIVDQRDKRPAALAIGELDPAVPEASLEWIQVHPDYQGIGLGGCLVSEMIRRVQDDVTLITVSGRIDEPDSPEEFYRRYGFTGDDVWWILRRT